MVRAVVGVVFVLTVIGLAGWLGYSYQSAICERNASTLQLEVSEALDVLARKYGKADALYRAERNKTEAAFDRGLDRGKKFVADLPDRGCGYTRDERVVMHETYCAAFPTAPDCMP